LPRVILLKFYKLRSGKIMKKLLFVVIAVLSFNQMPIAFADDALPEIAPVDDPAPPPIDAPAPEEAK
jgi:hypothetical protein